MSYINRESLLAEINEVFPDLNMFNNEEATAIKMRIATAPTADVVEVRHVEWKYHECVSSYDGCKSGYSCSVCNAFVDEEMFDTDEFHKAFCGNCGAKMDGERKEQNEG